MTDDALTPVDYDPFAKQQEAPSSAPSAIAGATPVDYDPFNMPGQGDGGNTAMAGDAGAPDFGQDDPENVKQGQAAVAASKPGEAFADAGKAAVVSTGAGLGKLPWQLSKVTALAAGTLPQGYDAITGLFRKGGNDNAAGDAWSKYMIAPADAALDTMDEAVADQAQTHPGIAKAGAMFGDTASNMAGAVLTGGATDIPSAITMGGKLFAELSGKELATATITDALASSAAASAPTALAHGEEAGEKAYDETGSAVAGLTAGVGTAASTVLTNALPAGVNGGLGERIAAGAVAGGAGNEMSREIGNSVMPDKMKQDFSWSDTGWGMVMGAGFGLAFHGQHQADPQETVMRYNELQKGVEAGDESAIRTNGVLSQLTMVDGLSPHAIDAAEAGTKAADDVQNADHDALMAKSSRYREVYASATPNMSPDEAMAYAKSTVAQEQQTNVSWDSYLQAQNFNDKQASTGKVYQQVRDLYAQAEKVLPDVEMQKVTRWAFNEQRSPLEVRKALNDAIMDKAAPDYVAENYGDDFHDDGYLTQAAFEKDSANHPDKMPAAWPDTPEVQAALDEARINPYKLDDGRLAVIGDHDALASVTAHMLDKTGIAPQTGELHGNAKPEAGLHTEQRSAPTGTDEGVKEGDAPAGGREAEDREPAQADGRVGEGEREATEVTRAAPLREALADVGDHVAVSERGEVRISPEAPAAVVERALDAAARDTAADTTDYNEPTEAQAKAGNYRKGGVLFKSSEGDVRVRIENPDGSVRKGQGWSRPVRGAHYGYIPHTKGADGDPLDVFLTRHAHDASRPVAVISQHDPVTGKFDELKVVMGAKNRAEAMRLYRRQYPGGMANKMMPKGEGNVVMMSRAKFAKFVRSGAVDVPPHPVSGAPMERLRTTREVAPADKPGEGKTIQQRIAEAKVAKARKASGDTYVRDDVADTRVSLDKLGLDYDPTSLPKARRLMAQAERGEVPRRWPLAVRDNGDGTHTVLKGADTVTVGRELGVTDMPATVVDKAGPGSFLTERGILTGAPAKRLTRIYRDAAAAKPQFDAMLHDFADSMGAELHLGKLKGRDRSEEKIRDDYQSDPTRIKDLVRGTVVFKDVASAIEGLSKIGGVAKVIEVKDSLTKPSDMGYRDAKVIVELANGVKAEIQLNTKAMVEAKELGGHDMYKLARTLDPVGPDFAKLAGISREYYEAVWDSNDAASVPKPDLRTIESNSDRSTAYAESLPETNSADKSLPSRTRTNRPGPKETPGTSSPEISKNLGKEDTAEPSGEPTVGLKSSVAEAEHRDTIAAHAEKVVADWKNRPEIEVVTHRDDLDEGTRARLDTVLGEGVTPRGMFHNGKVTLFASQLHGVEDAERTILHETVGHLGLRGVMGDRLNGVLDSVHESVKDSPAFTKVMDTYKAAYGRRGGVALHRDVTEEYLARIAESGEDPGTWKKFVAGFRTWARDHGFVTKWTENDLRVMMAGVARDMREGRVSLAGHEPPQATFNEEAGEVASTYVGTAGRGTVTQDYAGSYRNLSIDGLEATVMSRDLNGTPALSVGDLKLAKPADLIRLTRFAGEEGKGVVAIGKDVLTRDVLERSGVPFTERPGHWELAASDGRGPVMFSLRHQASTTPEVEAILKKAIAHPDSNLTAWDRFQNSMRDIRDNVQSGQTMLNLKQNYVDALAPIAHYERTQNGGLLLDAQHSAYKAAWMAKNNEQITAGVLRLGVPEFTNGSFTTVAGRKGLLEIMQPLFNTPDGKGLDMLWEGYAMAKRSNELIKQLNDDGTSKEKLLSQDEIDKLLDLEKAHPIFKKVFDEYQEFNKQLLDLAVERGTLSKETSDLWSQNMYVPFYRALEENSNESNEWRSGKGVSGKKVSSMRLYGSDKAVEPVIENILKNTGSILDKVYANEAMRRVVSLTDGIGMERVKIPMKGVELSLGEIEKVLGRIGFHVGGKKNGKYTNSVAAGDMEKLVAFFKQSKPAGPDIVSVMEKGKAIYYKVTDQNLYRAVTAFNDIGSFDKVLGTILGLPKKVITLGVTLDPRFMYRNLFRDTITTAVQSGTNPNMFKDMFKNAGEVWKDGEFINKLRVAGYNGNEYFKVNEMREFMRDMHQSKATLLNTPAAIWRGYHKIGFVSEQLTRMRIAKHTLDNGGSMAEAAWQAQNTLNFQMRGDSKAMQLLIRAVPFLNARIQGLNRLYDGIGGRDVTFDRRKAVTSFALKSMSVMVAGMALAAYNKDDPRYQRIPESAKDTYYHLFIGNHHFILPKPFEIGSLMTTVPERIFRKATGRDNMRTFVESMQRVAMGIFSFDPTPQIAKPLIEDWANKDGFTGSPVVDQSLSGLEPGEQYTPKTSPTIKAVAQHMPHVLPDALRSPERLEHLYKGYGAQVGMYLLMASDAAVRAATSAPAQPASRYGNKLVGALEGTVGMGDDATDPRTKYIQQLYDAQDNADRAANTIQAQLKQGHAEEAKETMTENKTALSYRSAIHSVAAQMKTLRQNETMIYQSPVMSSETKREKLDQINSVKRRLLERVAPVLEQASDYQ